MNECEWFELIEFVEEFDMGANYVEGPPGPPGPPGEAIFIPSVSSDGVISWTNTAGLPNPDPVNIKGPQGEAGGVASVNGQTGEVSLDAAAVGAVPAGVFFTNNLGAGYTYTFTTSGTARFLLFIVGSADTTKGFYICNFAATGAGSIYAVKETSRVPVSVSADYTLTVQAINGATLGFIILSGSVTLSSQGPTPSS